MHDCGGDGLLEKIKNASLTTIDNDAGPRYNTKSV